MKTRITRIIVLIGTATLLAMPLQAGQGGGGGGGNAGECPYGYEPGTRAQQDRVRPLDGTGQGRGKGQDGGGRGLGNGNPEDCPNKQS